jgi:PKD repeat protein
VGVVVSKSLTTTVNPAPVASASASTYAPATGDTVTFTENQTGGAGAYAYAWTFGDGSTSGSQNPSCSYASAGTYIVRFWVNDSAGGSSLTTLTVVVSMSASMILSTPTGALYAILAFVLGLIIGAVVMMASGAVPQRANRPPRRRRWGERPPSP